MKFVGITVEFGVIREWRRDGNTPSRSTRNNHELKWIMEKSF